MKTKERKPKDWTPRCPRCSWKMKADGEFDVVALSAATSSEPLADAKLVWKFTCEDCGTSIFMEPKDCKPPVLDELDRG